MGKFEQNIPQAIADIGAKIMKLKRESQSLDWGHECDCEFCEDHHDAPNETYKRAKQIDKEIDALEDEQVRLRRHAAYCKVEVPA